MLSLNRNSLHTAGFNFYSHFYRGTRQAALQACAILTVALLTACGGADDPQANNNGNPGSGSSVLASPDVVSTKQDSAVNIPILANDSGISGSPVISIEVAPKNGSASVMANNTINYTPDADFTGKESFSYKLAINDKVSIATVTVNVQCDGCAKEIKINLSWLPTKNDDDIGYLVYYGNDKSNINNFAYDLTLLTGLDPNAPKVELSAQNDLKLSQGDTVCFQISAYTSSSQSNFSSPVCGTI